MISDLDQAADYCAAVSDQPELRIAISLQTMTSGSINCRTNQAKLTYETV